MSRPTTGDMQKQEMLKKFMAEVLNNNVFFYPAPYLEKYPR